MNRRRHLLAASVLLLTVGWTPAQFRNFGDRAGLRDHIALLQLLYQQYLGRLPDPDGLRTFTEQLRNGVPQLEVEAQLLASEEFYNRAGGSPVGFIRALYRVVLDRRPAPAEVRFWLERHVGRDRLTIAREFLIRSRTGM
jgi:hypothetical protein